VDKNNEEKTGKRQKSYDDCQINSKPREEELSKETLEYLEGVANRNEDNSIYYIK